MLMRKRNEIRELFEPISPTQRFIFAYEHTIKQKSESKKAHATDICVYAHKLKLAQKSAYCRSLTAKMQEENIDNLG